MLRWRVFAAVLGKEFAEALRERHVRIVLVAGLVFPLLFGWSFVEADAKRGRAPAEESGSRSGDGAAAAWGYRGSGPGERSLRPFTLAATVGYGALLAAIFTVTLALESFAGEKERRTIEVLLAAPASDRELFASKILSCVLLACLLGAAFELVAAGGLALVARGRGLEVSWWALGRALLWSLALLAGTSLTFASLGVVISSRVSTVKAGGQVLGVLMLALAALVALGGFAAGAHEAKVKAALEALRQVPGWKLGAAALLVLGLLDWGLVAVGARTFRRERLVAGN